MVVRALIVLFAAVFATLPSFAQSNEFSHVEVRAVPVQGGIFVLTGSGGNIGVSSGTDGMLVIDNQFAPLTPKIREALKGISDKRVRFVLNTHWHQDHTGGNINFGQAGIPIVAHENVRKRMSYPQVLDIFDRDVPASPDAALPILTFGDAVTFHLNNDVINVLHVPAAHTDGDSIVHFRKANVVHMGDVLFNGMYPFIDVSSGGSIDGVIAAVDIAIELCNERTKIIPGHGPVTDAKGLGRYARMLRSVRQNVASLIEEGKDLEAIQAAKPTAEFDEDWGGGFIKPDLFVELAYTSLTR